MKTVNQVLNEAVVALSSNNVANPNLDARLLLQYSLNLTPENLIQQQERSISLQELDRFNQLIKRRINKEPVSKITGQKEFWSMHFRTTIDTLDPRPDSETLIEAVLENFPDKNRPYKIIDLGTGTGCLMLTLLSEYKNATGIAADISQKALDVAKYNAENLGLEKKSEFILSNWMEKVSGKFDIIISNPPYIKTAEIEKLKPEVKDYDPLSALDGGFDGLDCYREISSHVKERLAANGKLFLEIGQGMESDIINILAENGLRLHNMKRDLAGIVRCLVVSN